jgi:hypothetical protein
MTDAKRFTVGELRQLLHGVPDEADLWIDTGVEFHRPIVQVFDRGGQPGQLVLLTTEE